MQLQELKKMQRYPLPQVEFGRPANIAFIPQTNSQVNWSISTGVDAQTSDMHLAQVQALTALSEQLAIWLAGALNALRSYNESAIPSIMSILEPFMVETSGMDFSFPPKSSRKITVEITRRGKVEPTIYFDE